MMQVDRQSESQIRRSAAKRTAWIVGAIALAVYALAIVEGVLQR